MHTIQSGNTILVADRVKMEPNVPARTKQCFIRVPYVFKGRPVVNVTVSTESSTIPMPVFGVQPPEVAPTGETLFKVSAVSVEAEDNAFEYWCDFTMVREL
jgi:hypothetical protein